MLRQLVSLAPGPSLVEQPPKQGAERAMQATRSALAGQATQSAGAMQAVRSALAGQPALSA